MYTINQNAGHPTKSAPANQNNADQSTQNQDDWKSNPYRKALREAMFLAFVQLFIEANVERARLTGKPSDGLEKILKNSETFTEGVFSRMDFSFEIGGK